jgi:hypothetical protein
MRDVIEPAAVVLILDRPYPLRLTMRGLADIEGRYGTVRAAFAALRCSDDDTVDALVFFITVLSYKSEHETVREALTAENIVCAYQKVLEAFNIGLRGSRAEYAEREQVSESDIFTLDWDWWYYIARARFGFSDGEFWDSAPRKFFALCDMWARDNIAGKSETAVADETDTERAVNNAGW